MDTTTQTCQLLEWLSVRPRTREEALEAWRTSCPRLSVWEDAHIDGLIESAAQGPWLAVSARGQQLLRSRREGR